MLNDQEYMGNIIGDLNSRRGIVNELGTRSNLHVVNASVPLAEARRVTRKSNVLMYISLHGATVHEQ